MREHSLLEIHSEKGGDQNAEDENNKRITVEECVKTILEASDRRGRKVFIIYKKIKRD